ncbi:stanniocalcin-like protein, partial [Mytilus galloprovincialis]
MSYIDIGRCVKYINGKSDFFVTKFYAESSYLHCTLYTIEGMDLTLCKFVLIFLVTFPKFTTASVDPECVAKGNSGDCQFYKCFEQQRQCGSSGYLLAFAYKYCNRRKSFFSSFTTAGQKSMDCATPCLTKALIGKYKESLGPGQKCNELKTYAFNNHVKCYQNCVSCDVYLSNKAVVRKVYSFSDPLTLEAWKQISAFEKKCNIG